ncbi:MAG TPA: dTMP kinase [Nannocystis exedens]|nr:dTMP kinase [Nannocystis exedens]
MSEARALFIALEGIDGSGTSTQTRALAARLRERGHRVLETCEPSRGPIGRMIRERLSTRSAPIDPAALALLFAADRLDHLANEIEPALAQGIVVISDRYVLSSLVYQSIECHGPWVREINARARWPDICALVSLPSDTAVDRVTARQATDGGKKERYDKPDLQCRLAAGYQRAYESQEPGPIVRVDGALSIDAVTEDLLQLCVNRGL